MLAVGDRRGELLTTINLALLRGMAGDVDGGFGADFAPPSGPGFIPFAAESGDLLANASAKRLRKNVPLIVGNLGPATFGQDDNTLLLVDADGERALPTADKLSLARTLVADIAQRLEAAA